jgi:hypothetical protein
MINKATGTVIATSSYLITVPTPIK